VFINTKIASGRYVRRWRFLLRHLHCHFIGWQNILKRRHFEEINAEGLERKKTHTEHHHTRPISNLICVAGKCFYDELAAVSSKLARK